MKKFIAYEKLSKKEQKELNAEKRKTWGDVKPITKVKPSAKLYNRKKKQDLTSYSKLNPVFLFYNTIQSVSLRTSYCSIHLTVSFRPQSKGLILNLWMGGLNCTENYCFRP